MSSGVSVDNLFVVDYVESDWPLVSAIHDLARPIELEGSCDPRAFVPLAEDTDDLEEFHACQKLVARVGDQVVGFVGIKGAEIGWLYIHPRLTGKGYGRLLLQAGLARIALAGFRQASVCVLDGNTRALNLYRSEGFSIVEAFKSRNNGYPCTVLKLSQ